MASTTFPFAIRTATRNLSRSAFPCERYVDVSVSAVIPTAVRWSFLLFVFSFPFEATALGFMQGSLSLPRVFGLLFFVSYFFYYGPFARRRSFPKISKPLGWFFVYLSVFILDVLFDDSFLLESLSRCFTLLQLFVFFWIGTELLRERTFARATLLTYAIASALLAAGNILRLPGFYDQFNPDRVTALGDNPNEVAAYMALALVVVMGLFLYGSFKRGRSRVFLVILVGLPTMGLIVATGSRGGILAFLAGCLIYLMPYWRSKAQFTGSILAIVAASAVVYMIVQNAELLERWHEANEGSLSGREEIIPQAIGMILERPVLGWHPTTWFYELGLRLGVWTGKDAHNLVLALLLEVGIVGTIPFLAGFWLCAREAWKARHGHLGLLPLALVVTIFAMGMSATTLGWKTQWLALALAFAASGKISRQLPLYLPHRRFKKTTGVPGVRATSLRSFGVSPAIK